VVEPVFSPFLFAVQVERARHELVTSLDAALWHLDASFASTRALALIADRGGPIHAGEVGRSMGVSRQAAAALLKRHENAGRVRIVDEGWARTVRITAEGHEHLAACVQAIDSALGALHGISDMDLIALGDGLHRARIALGRRRRPAWTWDD
jgi:DNA-binding MarR family transcriptional regulator